MPNGVCLFIHSGLSTFVQMDKLHLESKMDLYELRFSPQSPMAILKSLFAQVTTLIKLRKKLQFIFIWFADYHSFIPILFSKFFKTPVCLILGGSDCQFIETYKLGNIYGPLGIRKFFVHYSIRNAGKLYPVDSSLIYNENTFIESDRVYKLGVKTFFPEVSNIHVQPTSLKENFWRRETKENIILSIASINSSKRLLLKGADFYIELAKRMPEQTFIFVGMEETFLKTMSFPENMSVYGHLSPDKIVDLYAKAKVFCLFSLYEGLPNVLIEAMASGCIPVVSNVSGMPEAVSEYGYILKRKNVGEAEKLCRKALAEPESVHAEIEQYAKERYHFKHRKAFLDSLISEEVITKGVK